MGAEIAGVVASTIDQGGFSTAHELSPHQIHPWRWNNPAVMPKPALAVENRHFKPRVVGSVAGGPDDCFDLADCQVHAEWRRRLNTGWRQAMWRAGCVIEAVLLRPLIEFGLAIFPF